MRLFDLIQLHTPAVQPGNSKLHLATWTGYSHPIEEFYAGRFEAWQSWQNKRNFERDYIVSLARLPVRDRWLFVGCFRRLGLTWTETPAPHWSYQTEPLAAVEPLVGRLVIGFHRAGRAAYLDAERWSGDLDVLQLRERRMSVAEFPGYHRVRIRKSTLDLIVGQEITSWKAALSAVAGVYLIADTLTGRLYVGSATGEGGIWARWSAYAACGHGGNVDLVKLLADKGPTYAEHFQFAVLEIADTHAGSEEVLARESYWKEVLLSRVHGYNAN